MVWWDYTRNKDFILIYVMEIHYSICSLIPDGIEFLKHFKTIQEAKQFKEEHDPEGETIFIAKFVDGLLVQTM